MGYTHGLYGIVRCNAREIRLILLFFPAIFQGDFLKFHNEEARALFEWNVQKSNDFFADIKIRTGKMQSTVAKILSK